MTAAKFCEFIPAKKRGLASNDGKTAKEAGRTGVEEAKTVADEGSDDKVEVGLGELAVEEEGRDRDEETDENRHRDDLVGLAGCEHLLGDCWWTKEGTRRERRRRGARRWKEKKEVRKREVGGAKSLFSGAGGRREEQGDVQPPHVVA